MLAKGCGGEGRTRACQRCPRHHKDIDIWVTIGATVPHPLPARSSARPLAVQTAIRPRRTRTVSKAGIRHGCQTLGRQRSEILSRQKYHSASHLCLTGPSNRAQTPSLDGASKPACGLSPGNFMQVSSQFQSYIQQVLPPVTKWRDCRLAQMVEK